MQPGKYENWNGNIDPMEVVETFSLADYQRVRVEPLDTKTTPLPPEGDKRRAHVINVLNSATDLFVEGMRLKFHPQRPTPIEVGTSAAVVGAPAVDVAAANAATNPPTAPPAPVSAAGEMSPPSGSSPTATPALRTLLIRGRVRELNPGSKAARVSWVSARSGHTDAEIIGEVADADSGEVLLRFMTGRGSSGLMSPAGGDYETLMSNDTRDDGANVGEMLTQFK